MDTRVIYNIRNAIFILIITGALFAVLFVRPRSSGRQDIVKETAGTQVLYGGALPILVSIADTDEERQQGLSHTAKLAPQTGMLFIFDTPGRYGFWMKDMQYPLDIVWLDADMRVISVDENVRPESYPETVYPAEDARYVLELNAFEASRIGIVSGQKLYFKETF